MSAPASTGPKWRNSPFMRGTSASPGPSPSSNIPKPLSMGLTSPGPSALGHARHQSFSPLTAAQQMPSRSDSTRKRSNSYRSGSPATGTFAPTFIKSEEMQKPMPTINNIEGENDFSGKRYVWLRDAETTFVKGWVVEELDNGHLVVQCDDNSVCFGPGSCCLSLPDEVS
jgi:myosin protein heavy chain